MKFLVKINRWYFSLLFITLILISIVSYKVIRNLIIRDTKEKLTEKEFYILEQVKNDSIIPNFYPFVEIKKETEQQAETCGFQTVYLTNKLENNEPEPYLEYSTSYLKDGTTYSIKLRQSMLENEDLLITISIALSSILIIVFIAIFLLNKMITKKIWLQFEKNLAEIKNYSFDKPGRLKTSETGIEEFDNLNSVFHELTNRLRADYANTKEFAENASHEMQTPLSVMIMNLENLLQERLPDPVTARIYETYQSSIKLQKLSKNLLLLTKIENHQFTDLQQIDLSELLTRKMANFEPLISLHNIQVTQNIYTSLLVSMDPLIADVLINNLLSNAINHNVENGTISITTSENRLIIENTTAEQAIDTREIFKRFKKGKSKVNSSGLGLAIVKSITKVSSLEISIEQHSDTVQVILKRK